MRPSYREGEQIPFDEEVGVRTPLRKLWEAVRELTGPGASGNAHSEVEGALRSVAELERQLGNVRDPSSRRAA